MSNTAEVNDTIRRINELISKLPANVAKPQIIPLLYTQPAVIDRQTIAKLLTHHAVCRKDQQWPLVPWGEMERLKKWLVDGKIAPQVNHADVLQVGHSRVPWMDKHVNPIPTLGAAFPLLERILMIAPGSVVVAGGAVWLAINSSWIDHSADLDVFFHSMLPEDAEKVLRAFILQIIKENPGLVYVTRNQMVTTMYVRTEDQRDYKPWEGKKYQFVHRVYPNKSCIIGGFDLDCSAVLYDGTDIYATPLCAFTYSREMLIADLSRLSTSHSDRVRKYLSRGYLHSMIFTTTSRDEIINSLNQSLVEVKSCNMWIGGGLNAKISEVYNGKRSISIASKTRECEDGTIVDYEAYDNADSDMARANTQMLLRGNYACVKWGGVTEQEIFDPTLDQIKILDFAGFEAAHSRRSIESVASAVRWIPYEEVKSAKGVDRFDTREKIKALFTPERVQKLIDVARSRRLDIKLNAQWLAPDDNPGRQFTSSFHPLDDVVGWYNPRLYKPFKIGVLPEIWATARCAQKRRDGNLGILTRDCLIVVFRHLWRLIAEEGMRIALCL